MTSPVPAESVGAAACVSCGGVVAWNAARQRLVCRSCGTDAPEPASPAGPVEHFPLLPRLADRPDSGRDWQPRPTHLRCRSCQAVVACDEHVVGRACDACGTPALVPSDATGAPVLPSGVVPFRVSETDARAGLAGWLKAKHVGRCAIETIRGVYLPCWVFNARVSCRWRGERLRSRDGNTDRIAIDGIVERDFDDYLIPASSTIDGALLAKVDPFPIAEARAYDTRYLSGFTTEIYTRNLWDAWDTASARMEAGLNSDLRHDSKCEPYELETWPEWRDQRCALVLVPAYAITFRHGKETYPAVVSGWTGEVAAVRPTNLSLLVIGLAIVVAVFGGAAYFLWRLLQAAS